MPAVRPVRVKRWIVLEVAAEPPATSRLSGTVPVRTVPAQAPVDWFAAAPKARLPVVGAVVVRTTEKVVSPASVRIGALAVKVPARERRVCFLKWTAWRVTGRDEDARCAVSVACAVWPPGPAARACC